jgi:hypothetical protein
MRASAAIAPCCSITLGSMQAARALYRDLGFVPVGAVLRQSAAGRGTWRSSWANNYL